MRWPWPWTPAAPPEQSPEQAREARVLALIYTDDQVALALAGKPIRTRAAEEFAARVLRADEEQRGDE
jgi:hypothetical protein